MSACTSPARSSKLTPSSAWTPGNAFVMPAQLQKRRGAARTLRLDPAAIHPPIPAVAAPTRRADRAAALLPRTAIDVGEIVRQTELRNDVADA